MTSRTRCARSSPSKAMPSIVTPTTMASGVTSSHYPDLGFEDQAVAVSVSVWEGSIQHNGCRWSPSLSGFVDASSSRKDVGPGFSLCWRTFGPIPGVCSAGSGGLICCKKMVCQREYGVLTHKKQHSIEPIALLGSLGLSWALLGSRFAM